MLLRTQDINSTLLLGFWPHRTKQGCNTTGLAKEFGPGALKYISYPPLGEGIDGDGECFDGWHLNTDAHWCYWTSYFYFKNESNLIFFLLKYC